MISKKIRRKLLLTAIVAQLAVLVFMAVKRETIIAFGETVYLRTAPIDPRDPFRGDYVRLNYDINRFYQHQYQGEKPFSELSKGTIVFAVLQKNLNDDVYYSNYFTDHIPEKKPFIKGRISTRRWSFFDSANYRDVLFGIEKKYVQQGKGKEMEKRLGVRNGLQVPAEVQIALGNDGTAVISGHRWSKLGIQLSFIRTTNRGSSTEENTSPKSPIVNIVFENVSDAPLIFSSLNDNCSFSLSQINHLSTSENLAISCNNDKKPDIQKITLKPGENHSFNIDLSKPRWFIPNELGKMVEIAELNLSERYRLRYHAPVIDGVWQGFIDTPAFRPTGNID